jgi:hypothetical protein
MPKADVTRWVPLEDVAQVTLFLLSDAARSITGASIPIYGQSSPSCLEAYPLEGRDARILRNGSCGLSRASQLLELEQHGEHALQLTVKVNLVARHALQLTRPKRLAQSLGAEQGPALQLLALSVAPGTDLLLDEAQQAFIEEALPASFAFEPLDQGLRAADERGEFAPIGDGARRVASMLKGVAVPPRRAGRAAPVHAALSVRHRW